MVPHIGLTGAASKMGKDDDFKALKLQESMNQIFGRADAQKLNEVEFSLSFADPSLDDCPIIGCSTGFLKLHGYEMHEVVGRNCRFLVDPVPPEFVDQHARAKAREFCMSVIEGRDYQAPDDIEDDSWNTQGRHADDGIFCVNVNMRKDGTLFRNMFYMRTIDLNDKSVIVALQAEVDEDAEMFDHCSLMRACRLLDSNMDKVQEMLATIFWTQSSMRRQEGEVDDGFDMMSDCSDID
eukprot:TRINITY_DN22523_c0_g2_i1.p1 TRINITY_DN22523_c0_g2~~TRINITY_DN22523_c0_g2_i1.p1  ORF type:complete len:238 (+),score=56.92 TRINITY_DN22523_c0_g2_i1:62-775(+)